MEKSISIEQSLGVLGLKTASKRVLVCLIEQGESSVSSLSKALTMPKSSIYDALDELLNKSLITEYSDGRAKTFGISDREQLIRVQNNKIDELKNAQSSLITYIKHHKKEDRTTKPKIKFYSGTEGIRQAFRDMPWNKEDKEAYLMWPTLEMINSLGEEFLFEHRKPGVELGVIVNVIERESDRKIGKDHAWLRNDMKERLNKKRYLPNNTQWEMSYWIYGDKVLFASGGTEKIAFAVHSKEFADLQKIMWKRMWDSAKE